MGYESRVRVVNMLNEGYYAEVIATLNLCCMGAEFVELFNKAKEINFSYYIEFSDEPVREDSYGKPPKYVEFNVIKEFVNRPDLPPDILDYRRFVILKGLINSIDETRWDNLYVIHEGY